MQKGKWRFPSPLFSLLYVSISPLLLPPSPAVAARSLSCFCRYGLCQWYCLRSDGLCQFSLLAYLHTDGLWHPILVGKPAFSTLKIFALFFLSPRRPTPKPKPNNKQATRVFEATMATNPRPWPKLTIGSLNLRGDIEEAARAVCRHLLQQQHLEHAAAINRQNQSQRPAEVKRRAHRIRPNPQLAGVTIPM